jgi:hypothetical protein
VTYDSAFLDRTCLTATLLGAALLSNGCGRGESADADAQGGAARASEVGGVQTRVDTLPDGMVVVSNSVSARGVVAPTWSAVEEWRFAEEEGAGMRGLVVLSSAPARRVQLLDAGRRSVHLFELDGRQVASVDLAASGIPDSVQLRAAITDPHGLLIVRGHNGYWTLDEAGRIVATTAASFSPSSHPYTGSWDDAGRLVESRTVLGPAEGAERLIRVLLIRSDIRSASVDTLPPVDLTVGLVPGTPLPKPQTNITRLASAGPSIWFGESHRYRVFRRTLDGDTTLSFSLDAPAAPIPAADKPARAREWSRSYDIPAETVPDFEPILYRIVPLGKDRVAVFPHLAAAPRGSIADIFQAGRFEGRLSLPFPIEVLHHQPVFVDDRLIAVTYDEAGLGSVVGLRIPGWPASAAGP